MNCCRLRLSFMWLLPRFLPVTHCAPPLSEQSLGLLFPSPLFLFFVFIQEGVIKAPFGDPSGFSIFFSFCLCFSCNIQVMLLLCTHPCAMTINSILNIFIWFYLFVFWWANPCFFYLYFFLGSLFKNFCGVNLFAPSILSVIRRFAFKVRLQDRFKVSKLA